MNYRKRKKAIKKKIAAGSMLTDPEMRFAVQHGLVKNYASLMCACARFGKMAAGVAKVCAIFSKSLSEYFDNANSAFELISDACSNFRDELDSTISKYK